MTEVGTKEVEEMQQDLKYSSLLSFMLKPTSFLTQGFKENQKALEKLFNSMCDFGSQEQWGGGRRAFSSYIDVDTSKDQCRLINPTPLDCIAGYIMEGYVGDRFLRRLPHIRLKLIDGSISSYCYIINFPERFDLINQEKKLASILGVIESDRLG